VDAAAYANRIVALRPDRDALAGIRFRPSESAFFVDLVAVSRPFADADELADAVRVLAEQFAGFRPRWVRLYAADERLARDARLLGDFVVAARAVELAARPVAAGVELVRRLAAEAYDDYARLYADFHAAAPRNAELAHVEDLDTLQRWERDRGVFEIRVDGVRAGYCGARRWNRYGVRGWCAAEIILAAEFRGRGLAASAHRRMASMLDAAPGDALWAEVHEDNAPSLRSGLRAGYAVIGRVLRLSTGEGCRL
jgi:RimJ/RimL family protein N-acetyltransferase